MRPELLCILLVCGSAIPASAQQLKEITNSIGMKLVLIHAGSFTMGSPEDEEGRNDNELQHEVTISKSFYLGAYEVTQEQYEKVMGINPSHYNGPKNPVEKVSWEDSISFCKKLSELPDEIAARREYRLPTEAEWEYACRATSTTAYCFGDAADELWDDAWFGENAGRNPHPVGEKKPNRWGLYDMHGNVSEWCQRHVDYPSDAATDPLGPIRISIRGGSWGDNAGGCRSAYLSRSRPSFRFNGSIYGFRVAMSLPIKQPESASSK